MNDILVRRASQEDVPDIVEIARDLRAVVGYAAQTLFDAAIRRGEVVVATVGGVVRGYCWSQRRVDGLTVVLDVAPIGDACARAMVCTLPTPVRVKLPIHSTANDLYRDLGFERVGFEIGTSGAFALWCRS